MALEPGMGEYSVSDHFKRKTSPLSHFCNPMDSSSPLSHCFHALSRPTALSLLPSQRRGLHLFWHYYYFQGCVYQLQTSGHDARGRRATATAAEHPVAQPGSHITCVISAGYHSPHTDKSQIASALGPWFWHHHSWSCAGGISSHLAHPPKSWAEISAPGSCSR